MTKSGSETNATRQRTMADSSVRLRTKHVPVLTRYGGAENNGGTPDVAFMRHTPSRPPGRHNKTRNRTALRDPSQRVAVIREHQRVSLHALFSIPLALLFCVLVAAPRRFMHQQGLQVSKRQVQAGFTHFKHRTSLPLFQNDSIDALAVRQGQVGNCAFISALVVLAHQRPELLRSLFVQSLDFLTIRLFSGGTWHEVVVHPQEPWSDLLNQPLCAHSSRSESWVSALEQANLIHFNRGSYEDAASCTVIDLYHLTGFVPETVKCKSTADFASSKARLIQLFPLNLCLVCLGTQDVRDPQMTASGERVCGTTGLVENHSYSVLDISDSGLVIRNPWTIEGVENVASVTWDFVKEHFSHVYVAWDRASFRPAVSIDGNIGQGLRFLAEEEINGFIVFHRRVGDCKAISQSYVGIVVSANGATVSRSSMKNSEVVSLRHTFAPLADYHVTVDFSGYGEIDGILEILVVNGN